MNKIAPTSSSALPQQQSLDLSEEKPLKALDKPMSEDVSTADGEPADISLKGIGYGILGGLFYSLTQPLLKIIAILYPDFSTYEVLYWRSLGMAACTYAYCIATGNHVLGVPRKHHRIMIFRATIGFFGIQGMWESVRYMPVTLASCIMFTMPVWTALLGWLWLGEALQLIDIGALAAAFFGMLLINNPFGKASDQVQESGSGLTDSKVYTSTDKFIGSAIALSGSIAAALAMLCMRYMKTVNYTISPFWYSVSCTFFSPIFSATKMGSPEKTQSYDLILWLLILATMIASVGGQLFQSRAYQLEKAARVATTNYLQIVTAFLWDILIFKANLTAWELAGCLVIIGVLFSISLAKAMSWVV